MQSATPANASGELPLEIEPAEFDRMRKAGEPFKVLDVREAWELEICGFPDPLHLPLGDLPTRFNEVPNDRLVVVLCRTGRRSLQATTWLRSQGFQNAVNLRGGVHLWSDQIDPTMRKY